MQLPYRKPGKYMTQKHDPFLTQEKYAELEQTLKKLYTSRPQAAKEVARLAELGDFSENVEYQLAKGRLRGINHKILIIEHQLKQAEIITPKQSDSVQLGSTVTVEINGKEKKYTILGSAEANPTEGVISHTSPIGMALLGKKVNQTVELQLKDRLVTYKVINIQ